MKLRWIRENPPYWDAGKAEIVGGAPEGTFELKDYEVGQVVPGEWWRAESDGVVVGYGWMDYAWGDGEMLLAVDPTSRSRGVGSFILDHLDDEARERGLNYLHNVVPPTHPDRDATTRWLEKRGFRLSRDGRLMRRVKSPTGES